jgi:hypothetical protein
VSGGDIVAASALGASQPRLRCSRGSFAELFALPMPSLWKRDEIALPPVQHSPVGASIYMTKSRLWEDGV